MLKTEGGKMNLKNQQHTEESVSSSHLKEESGRLLFGRRFRLAVDDCVADSALRVKGSKEAKI